MVSFPCSILFFLAILLSHTNAQKGLTLPIRKDTKTSQFYTTIELGSNHVPMNAVLDLGAQDAWFGCDNYTSSTYAPISCTSNKCEVANGIGCVECFGPSHPDCFNNMCGTTGYNPFQGVLVAGGFAEDVLSSTNQSPVDQFIFSCLGSGFMEGLAHGTNGLIGLARTKISLHKHVADKFNLPDRFSMCLPSSGVGKLSIGGTPSSTISKTLRATPLIINPVSTAHIYSLGDPSDEYFIDVNSIRVAGELLPLKNSYFSIDKEGIGGTKITTTINFTALHNSIYKPFARAFSKAASGMKIKSVGAVSPFKACFSSKTIARTPAGPSVPTIDLILPGKDVYWRINGANSMVEIDQNTMCLAFVDGGSNPRTSIAIGVHQIEENFLEFDLVSSQLRFSSSLLVHNTKCSRL